MKNIFNLFAVFLMMFLGSKMIAQSEPIKTEDSLLWEVSGNGLSKPSYLYGTIHMICSSDYFLSDKTKKAFEASEKLVLEINVADPKEFSEMQQLAIGKEPLSKKLSPEQLNKLDAILKKTTGMSVKQVDSFNLLTVMSLISMKTFGCLDLKFYEMEFTEQAKERNIEIGGLETVKSQFAILEGAYTNDEMINMLDESTLEETDKLVSEYKSENIEGMYDVAADEKYTSAKIKKIILDERNLNWVKIMPDLMKKQSVFFAFGAAHLVGEFGVIKLLRNLGYTVKPVLNK
ncbi:TraB/GumN family protein [Flavobacterium sp. H4147]|uniref:TraB/GumN family protein n=1 Tax=Flavobacterium sp. H4147 TaxID=3034149 RepID=UPI0023EC2F5C|nr:TraB/GumN family protein [Flavobacterium sp. H4147]